MTAQLQLNRFHLKLIAVLTMLIDHIGLFFFPKILILRIIGRTSFPLFAFMIAEGYVHTSNLKRYFLRLFVFALCSELAFDLAFANTLFSSERQNIFITLILGLMAIMVYDKLFNKHLVLAFILFLLIGMVSVFVHADYGFPGVCLIFYFYIFRSNKIDQCLSLLIIMCLFSAFISQIQIFGTFAMIPILLYNGTKGKYSFQYFFYLFYPIHLILIHYITRIIQ